MKTITTILFILIFSVCAFGQDIEVTTKDGKKVILKSDKTWDYVTETPKKEVISPNTNTFSIDNPKEVIKFTSSLESEIKKSEFETEAEYQVRISKLIEEKQYNGKPIKQIAFLISPDSFNYSAESQSFDILIISGTGLRFVNRDYGSYLNFIIRKSFEMPPDKAKELKSTMEIVVLGFPVRSSVIGLEIVPNQIIVRNKQSGEIYLNDRIENFLSKAAKSDILSEQDTNSPTYPNNSTVPVYTPKTVQVDGYYRKDGTYVRPHTRKAPSRRKN